MKLPISEIKPNPDNPRLIKDDKFQKLVQSLKDFPEMAEVREVVINKDNMILGGNMRYKAAIEAGWKEIPVKVVDWPEDKQREFIIKDNVAGGEWDWDIIANEWDSKLLDDWGLDLPAGFGDEEVIEDDAPPVADVAVSKLGEIYQLGRHRLMCGDSTKDLGDLMIGENVDMIYTDPPYGLGGYGGRNDMDLKGDDEDVLKFYEAIPHVKEMYIWGNYKNLMQHLWDTPRDVIVWVKNNFGLGKGYRGQYELCFYYGDFSGSDSDVWQIDKDIKYEHPTQKPVSLAARAIRNSEPKSVLDLYGGSGSTLIACEQLDRTCYMMELDEKYCDVIRKRYWKFTHDNNEEGWEDGTPVISERAAINA